MTLAIRPSGHDEAETQLAVQRAASLAGMAHIFPADAPYPDDEVLENWRAFPGAVLLAQEGGAALGVAAFDACWLHGLYVVPEAWGTGVAAALHDAALAAMPDCPEVRLWALDQNGRARRFYEKLGWRRNGETRRSGWPPNPLSLGYSFIREEP